MRMADDGVVSGVNVLAVFVDVASTLEERECVDEWTKL